MLLFYRPEKLLSESDLELLISVIKTIKKYSKIGSMTIDFNIKMILKDSIISSFKLNK